MVVLRWSIPDPHHTRRVLPIHHIVPGPSRKDGHLDAHSHFPDTPGHPPIRPTVHAHSELAHILLRMRVRGPHPLYYRCFLLRRSPCSRQQSVINDLANMSLTFRLPRFIPSDWRPPIWVRVLPALENIFYGANLSNILSAHQNTFLDIMAWLPYGIIHFGAPVVCSAIMFVFASPGTVPVFARSFGYMNLVGVSIQLLFPCSPPWYENIYGLAPATYAIKGSPAGLARIDQLFGIALYIPAFTGSPMVFGAFPSLHAGSATVEALFMSHVFPRLRPFFIAYTLWLWWATMYLSHHYAVDLVGGSLRMSSTMLLYLLANLLQWPGSYFTSRSPNSSHECSRRRCSAGITTLRKLGKTPQRKATLLQILVQVITPMPMSGQLGPRLRYLQAH